MKSVMLLCMIIDLYEEQREWINLLEGTAILFEISAHCGSHYMSIFTDENFKILENINTMDLFMLC